MRRRFESRHSCSANGRMTPIRKIVNSEQLSRMSSHTSDAFRVEYEALTSGSGFVLLDGWSTVTIAGNDRVSFFHNMCTNDIRRLVPGEGCEAFCTDVKGKVVAHLFVVVLERQLILLAAAQ